MEDIKEKTADEIMAELGYEHCGYGDLSYIGPYGFELWFDEKDKTVVLDTAWVNTRTLSMPLLKAISKKVEELKW